MDGNYKCDPCGKRFSGIEPYMQHLESFKHKKKIEQQKLITTDSSSFDGNYHCKICDIMCSGIVPYQHHLQGEKHSKQEARMSSTQYYLSSGGMNPLKSEMDNPESETGSNFSEPTMKTVLDKKYMTSDLTPGTVNQRENALPELNNFCCTVCDKQFTGPIPYKQHMDSPIHQKNLKKKNVLQSALKSMMNGFPRTETPENLACISGMSDVNGTGEPSPPEEMASFECIYCEVNFPSAETYHFHKLSSAHREKEVEAGMPKIGMGDGDFPVAECYICGVKFYTNEEVVDHYGSESHHEKKYL